MRFKEFNIKEAISNAPDYLQDLINASKKPANTDYLNDLINSLRGNTTSDDEEDDDDYLDALIKGSAGAAGAAAIAPKTAQPGTRQPAQAINYPTGRQPAQPAQPAQATMGSSTSEIKPVQGPVTSNFGAARRGRSHPGTDIGVPSGTQIKAPITGQVTQAAMTNNDCGGTIAISNGKAQHRFCHCSKIYVSVGQYVRQGDIVGLTGGGRGDSGRGHSTGPHLHWEKKLASGGLVNPLA